MGITRWLWAAIHLLGLGVGLGAIWARARLLRRELTPVSLRQIFAADAWWGIAALMWVGSGLVRAFGGFEKGTAYYLDNHFFLTKMALLIVILVLEVGPITTLARWRLQVRRGEAIDPAPAGRYATTSTVQAVLVVIMVLLATGMARGYG